MIATVGKRDNEAIQEALNAPTMYTVTPLPDGFTVTRRDRVPVRVALRDGFFEVGCPGRDNIRPVASGLVTFSAMVDAVAKRLLTDWSPPKDRATSKWDIHGWCRKKTARIINKPVHEQWQRLLRKAAPEWSLSKGERASVQINRDTRRVVQAAGPRNRQNGAAKWGQRVLGKWAEGLPERELPSYEETCQHGGDRGPDMEIPF